MRGEFVNKVDWLAIALALTIWASHFMLVWVASSIFPHQSAARWIALVLTMAGLAGLWLVVRWRHVRSVNSIEGLALALAAVAVSYSALPAFVG